MSKKEPNSGPEHRLQGLHHSEPAIPWISATAWSEANGAIQDLYTRHHPSLGPVGKTVRDLKACLESTFPVLDSLCVQTCPECRAPCCHVATVWFDFKDLIFIHLAGLALPIAQLIRKPGEPCRCSGASGCSLPRLSRPWICSWYLCPSQKVLLAEMPGNSLDRFEKKVLEIKHLRNRMEAGFIRITS